VFVLLVGFENEWLMIEIRYTNMQNVDIQHKQ